MPPRNPHSGRFGNLAPVKGPSQVRSIATGSGRVTTVPGRIPTFTDLFLQRKECSKWQEESEVKTDPVIRENTEFLSDVTSCKASVPLRECPLSRGPRSQAPRQEAKVGKQGLAVDSEGCVFLHHCEWTDGVSRWMAQE